MTKTTQGDLACAALLALSIVLWLCGMWEAMGK